MELNVESDKLQIANSKGSINEQSYLAILLLNFAQ